jgi:acetyltransferase
MRFLHAMCKVPDGQVEQFTRIDHDWEISLVLDEVEFSNERALCGFIQTIPDPNRERAEFAILVRSDLTGMGIGRVLLKHIIACARKRGIREIYGESLLENAAMLRLASTLGFRFVESGDPESVVMTLSL